MLLNLLALSYAMQSLTSLDIHHLSRELEKLQDAKLEKIFQRKQDKHDLLFQMYKKDWPKVYLRFMLPGMLCIQKDKPVVYPQQPPGFAMFLRKYIQGARLLSARQKGFDRILEMRFARSDSEFTLLAEMMAPGNLLLLLPDGKIKGLLETQNFKDRTLRGGIEYEQPPEAFDPRSATDDELVSRITGSDKDSIVVTLAIVMGMGGTYAEEICARAGIDKNLGSLSREEILQVIGAMRGLFDLRIEPHKDEKAIYPFRMMSRNTIKCEDEMFLQALGSLIEEDAPVDLERQKTQKKHKDKIETMRKAQEKSVEKYEKKAREDEARAERIYLQYNELNQMLYEARTALAEKRSVEEALKKFPSFERYDPKDCLLEVSFDE